MSLPRRISLNLTGSFQLPTRSHVALCVMAYNIQGIYTELESVMWNYEGNCNKRFGAPQLLLGSCARASKVYLGCLKIKDLINIFCCWSSKCQLSYLN